MKKDEFVQLLKKSNISREEFSILAEIPLATVRNWGVSRKGRVLEIPNWVRPFMKHYEKSKKLDYIANEICGKLNEGKSLE